MGQYDDIISENVESINQELKKLNKTLNAFLNLSLIESSLKKKTPDEIVKVRNALKNIKDILKDS